MSRNRTEKLKIVGMHCASCAITIEKKLRTLRGVSYVAVNFATEEAEVKYDPSKITLKDIVNTIRAVGYDVYKEEAYITIQNISSVDDEVIIEGKVTGLPGVVDVKASHVAKGVSVTFNPLLISADRIKEFIESLGYRVISVKGEIEVEDIESKVLKKEIAKLKKVVALSLALSLPLVTYMMLGSFGIRLPFWGYRDVIGLALSTPVIFVGGHRFFVGAYKALRNRSAGMDTLVSLGTGTSYVFSLAVMAGIIKSAETYFEAGAVVVALVLLGKYLELRMKVHTGEAVRKLMELQAKAARVVRDGKEIEVPVDKVRVRDVAIIRSGERVPVDGIVIDGQGYVNESMLTGEPMPVLKRKGDPVIAGTILRSGFLKVVATRVGRETVLSQIIKLVRQAQMGKPPIQRLVDRVAGYFTWIVIAVAVLTFTYWYFVGGASLNLAVLFTASVLLVACPCALGLATPTAIVVGVGKAAELGIIVKNVDVLEKIPRLTSVVFDKTGTLTKGELKVTDVYAVNNYSEDDLLRLAYIAEKRSEHPIAQAIVREANELIDDYEAEPESFDSVPGQGVVASVNGKSVIVGNEKLMKAYGVELSPVTKVANELRDEGKTVVYVAVNGVLAGLIAVADTLREHSTDVVSYLKRKGLKIIMLTGDDNVTAKAIARKLGIDEVTAEVLPEDKVDVIKDLQKRGGIRADGWRRHKRCA